MDPTPVKLLILDVDGVLTDGRILFTADRERTKCFHVQDGCALKLWKRCGGKTAIVTGRDTEAVRRRMKELEIDWVHTDVPDKWLACQAILESADCDRRSAGYVGDDLPDLVPMSRVGFPVAVANAVPALKQIAAYVTHRPGGSGAVAEVVEFLLRKQNLWSRDRLMSL